MVAPLVMLAIKEAPGVIRLLREAFTKQHPGDPQPTDEEIVRAFQSALESSLAKDAAWLSAHPGVSGTISR